MASGLLCMHNFNNKEVVLESSTKTMLATLAMANINILKVSPRTVNFEFQWRDPNSHAARWSKQVLVRPDTATDYTTEVGFAKGLADVYELTQQAREQLER